MITKDTPNMAAEVTFDDVTPRKRRALWPGHHYFGTVSMTAGAGGTGKGLTGIYAAAVVTRGGLFVGEDPETTRDRTPGTVLGVWPEDDREEDLAWRLRAALGGAGADLELVVDMTTGPGGEDWVLDEAHINRMRRAIATRKRCTGTLPCGCGKPHRKRQYPVLLVLIDPLLAVTEHLSTNAQARQAMKLLMDMARDTGVAVELKHHTIKDGQIASSKGLTDVLRLVYRSQWQDEEERFVVLSKVKGNNIGKVDDLFYQIDGTDQEPFITWTDGEYRPDVATPASTGFYADPVSALRPAAPAAEPYVPQSSRLLVAAR